MAAAAVDAAASAVGVVRTVMVTERVTIGRLRGTLILSFPQWHVHQVPFMLDGRDGGCCGC